MRLNILSHGQDPGTHYNGMPASYLFVETILGSGILSENASGRIDGVMQAAISRLQAFLTPGASSDLESMLGFFAPKGGGLAKVRQMVQKAGTIQTPITQDRNWWQELFTVFNVQDQTVQQQIMAATVRSAGNPPQSEIPGVPGVPQSRPQAGAAPATDLAAKMQQNTQARQASAQRMAAIRGQMKALPPAVGEALCNHLAKQLMTETDVKSNLRFVASNLMKRLGYGSTTPVQEVNWLKKFATSFDRPVEEGFRDFFRNMRMMAANPDHLQAKAQNSALKSYNERVAKLAIQHLTDHITQEMETRLQVANLTVRDMIITVSEWQKVMAEKQKLNGQMTPQFKQKFHDTYDKMQRIVYALDPNLAKSQT